MTGVPDDRSLHLALLRVRNTQHLPVGTRLQGAFLDGSTITIQFSLWLVLRFGCSLISMTILIHVQTCSERVDVEEWVLAVVDLSSRHAIQALVASIADSRQIHVRLLLGDLDTLESNKKSVAISNLLSVMEIIRINDVLDLGRLKVFLQKSEVVL